MNTTCPSGRNCSSGDSFCHHLLVEAVNRTLIVTLLLGAAAAAAGCAEPPRDSSYSLSAAALVGTENYGPRIESAILQVLADQQDAWNAGSLRGFMEGFARTDDLRFASGGQVRTGWTETLQAYERGYPSPEAMGSLTFSDVDVKVLSDTWALVFGAWKLERSDDEPSGLFTLLFEKRPEGWRVVHDHTSSAALPTGD